MVASPVRRTLLCSARDERKANTRSRRRVGKDERSSKRRRRAVSAKTKEVRVSESEGQRGA